MQNKGITSHRYHFNTIERMLISHIINEIQIKKRMMDYWYLYWNDKRLSYLSFCIVKS